MIGTTLAVSAWSWRKEVSVQTDTKSLRLALLSSDLNPDRSRRRQGFLWGHSPGLRRRPLDHHDRYSRAWYAL